MKVSLVCALVAWMHLLHIATGYNGHKAAGHNGHNAANMRELKARLAVDPALRKEFIKASANLLGKSIFSHKVQTAEPPLVALWQASMYRPFGINLNIKEGIELLLLALRASPREESPRKRLEDFKSNPRLGLLLSILGLLDSVVSVVDKGRSFGSRRFNENDYSHIVRTSEGLVRGIKVREGGVNYISFFEIPYAIAPKRFRAPKPPKPYNGLLNAIKEKTFCPQRLSLLGQIAGTEDCLYLNVHLPAIISPKKLPVFVWVHGGGFNFGLGNSYIFKPYKMVNQGLVVVSFNYRLGALGFLSTGTKEAPGNAGMKDMVAALRWIKKNIHNFGGDPESITLYGVSSGAIAIEYLILSPSVKGLFKSVIIQSGSVFNPWAYQNDPMKYAYRLAKEMGSNATDARGVVQFLRRVNALEMVKAQEKMSLGEDPSAEYIPFIPTAERRIPGVEPFIEDHPENIMKSGNYVQVPHMIGFNDREGLMFLGKTQNDRDYVFSLDRYFEYYLPNDLLDGLQKPSQRDDVLNKVREYYFNGRPIGNDTALEAVTFLSDAKFLYGVHKSIKTRLETSRTPIYYSEFAYDGELGSYKYFYDLSVGGVSHADDLGYVLPLPYSAVYQGMNKVTELVALRYITMMTNFIKYGNPTPAVTSLLPVTWYPIQGPDTHDYMRITDTLEMKQNPNENRYTFWSTLYMYKKYLLMND